MPRFFITTAIDYTNAAPHIGHAYEKVLADVLARYHRLKGDDVFFLTGVDQHGQKVQQSAEKQGIPPQQFVDGITEKFVALWDKLDVRYDAWAATTDAQHKDCVRAILQRLWDEKDPTTGASRWIYKKSQRGFYSVRQEQFLTDKERGADGQFGPEWGQVEEREEENYYFRLAEHRPWLLALIGKRSAAGRPFVVPDFRVAELRNAVEKLEGDLCISRPKARLSWGIPFPFDEDFVTYVWFDALVNYISFAPGYDPAPPRPPEAFLQGWRTVTHDIGKDIMIPAHGVYWPVMLKALGFTDEDMPTLLVHGWWNIRNKEGDSEKMSKSLGNVVDPDVLADKYGAEALRYYLMSDIATGRDADFSEERLVQRYNTDLANSLGNLLNRTLSMAHKYREGRIRRTLPSAHSVSVDHHVNLYREAIEGVAQSSNVQSPLGGGFQIHRALEAAIGLATRCNELIDKQKPWTLAKDPGRSDELDAVLYELVESLRIIAILIAPVLPRASRGIFDQLNLSDPLKLQDALWGMLHGSTSPRLDDGSSLGLVDDRHIVGHPRPLFPRIEAPPVA